MVRGVAPLILFSNHLGRIHPYFPPIENPIDMVPVTASGEPMGCGLVGRGHGRGETGGRIFGEWIAKGFKTGALGRGVEVAGYHRGQVRGLSGQAF